MDLLRRWLNVRRRQREINKAIKGYNKALRTMAKAARRLLLVSRETGTETPRLTAAVMQIEKVAECALIRKSDLEGVKSVEKRER